MAKIKTLKIKLGDTIYDIVVKCNTKGKFTFEANSGLTGTIIKLGDIERNYFDSLKDLEDKIYQIIDEYKKAVIKRRLVIKVDFGASGKFIKDDEGYPLPQFSKLGGKFSMDDVFINGANLIKFGYKILMEESINDCITYYSTIKLFNSDLKDDRRIGDYMARNYRCLLGENEEVLPYTEEIINNLESIEKQLKNAALFLSELLSCDRVEQILTSGNLKLLGSGEN